MRVRTFSRPLEELDDLEGELNGFLDALEQAGGWAETPTFCLGLKTETSSIGGDVVMNHVAIWTVTYEPGEVPSPEEITAPEEAFPLPPPPIP